MSIKMDIEECFIISYYISNEKNYIYKGKYMKTNSIGEVIRNICVNLSIVPDTENGYTKNCRFYIKNKNDNKIDNKFNFNNFSISDIKKSNFLEWKYNPYDDINNVIKVKDDNNEGDDEKVLEIIIERID